MCVATLHCHHQHLFPSISSIAFVDFCCLPSEMVQVFRSEAAKDVMSGATESAAEGSAHFHRWGPGVSLSLCVAGCLALREAIGENVQSEASEDAISDPSALCGCTWSSSLNLSENWCCWQVGSTMKCSGQSERQELKGLLYLSRAWSPGTWRLATSPALCTQL